MSSSISRAELEAMDREELIQTVQSLADTVEDLQTSVELLQTSVWETIEDDMYGDYGSAAGSATIGEHDSLIDWIQSVESENNDLRERVDTLESEIDAIRDIGSERTSKEEKVAQVVTYALNESQTGTGRVKIKPSNVVGLTGVSTRYAYDLVDEIADTYDWALDPQEVSRRPDQDAPEKGVLIDCELVQRDPEALNKFNNGSDEQGGS